MKQATVISVGLHAAVLLWAVLTWNGRAMEATPAESLPVSFISDKDFSQMMKGQKEAPKKETPKPLVEKKDAPKPVERPKAKVAKKELNAESEKVPEPTPPPKPVEKKVAKAKTEPPPQKIDEIGEKIKQSEKKQKEAKAEPKPMPPHRPPRPRHKEPKFDADKIAALLDKREPTRVLATGDELNAAPSLGTAKGTDAHLSQSELDALRARLMALWNPPVGMQNSQRMQITIRIRFKRDGTLAMGPQVLTSGSGPLFNALRDSAVRAVFVGQPYTMLRPDHYDLWKEIDFTFDTSQMYHDMSER